MNALVYHTFGGEIRVERVPLPSETDDGIVVRVRACGICRSDWHGWKGHDSDIMDHGLPFVPGHELAGDVVRTGANVIRFRPGDAVAVPFILSCGACRECVRGRSTVCERQEQPGFTRWGGLAEFVLIPRADLNVSPLPSGVSYKAAAALGCRFTTAYRAVKQQGHICKGETLAIFGAGGLGLSAIAIGASLGASPIIAVDVSVAALKKAKQVGATHTLLMSDVADRVKNCSPAEALAAQIFKLTDGVGADVAIDAAGFIETCRGAVFSTRRGGRMVQVGLPLGKHDSPAIPMARVAAWELEVIGSHGIAANAMPGLLSLVAEKSLRPEELIGCEVSLEEGGAALMAMDCGSPVGITMVTRFSSSSKSTSDPTTSYLQSNTGMSKQLSKM